MFFNFLIILIILILLFILFKVYFLLFTRIRMYFSRFIVKLNIIFNVLSSFYFKYSNFFYHILFSIIYYLLLRIYLVILIFVVAYKHIYGLSTYLLPRLILIIFGILTIIQFTFFSTETSIVLLLLLIEKISEFSDAWQFYSLFCKSDDGMSDLIVFIITLCGLMLLFALFSWYIVFQL